MIALGVGGGLRLYGEHASGLFPTEPTSSCTQQTESKHGNGMENRAIFQNKTTCVGVWIVFHLKQTKRNHLTIWLTRP